MTSSKDSTFPILTSPPPLTCPLQMSQYYSLHPWDCIFGSLEHPSKIIGSMMDLHIFLTYFSFPKLLNGADWHPINVPIHMPQLYSIMMIGYPPFSITLHALKSTMLLLHILLLKITLNVTFKTIILFV